MSEENKDTKIVPEGGESVEKEEQEQEQKGSGGMLSFVGDPLGKGLQKGLSPIGAVVSTATKPVTSTVGGITKPAVGPLLGENEERMEVLGGANKDSYEHGKDSLGGRVQDADNPLGLDQTGKFGFQEEKK